MHDRIRANQAFLGNLYRRGPFQGHGFVCKAAQDPVYAGLDNEYTTSMRPVAEWVPWAVKNYQRNLDLLAAVPHDDVPTCDLSTGTHLYAAAFGCPVHRYPDSNPCALPLVRTAAEADRIEMPDIWKSPSLYRVFELGDAVRRGLGPHVPPGPPHTQTRLGTARLNRVPAKCGKAGFEPMLRHLAGPAGPVHVLAWLPDPTIETLIQAAPPGTRFIFAKLGADAESARAWMEKMRALSPRLG
jgi:hypothetical protein